MPKAPPFHLKIKLSVFVILIENLLASSHFERDLRSHLLISFIVLLMFKKQESAAKWKADEFLIENLRSLIKIKKSKVLRQVLVVLYIL